MRSLRVVSLIAGLLLSVGGRSAVIGQVVQLPTYRVFAVQTSVLVPAHHSFHGHHLHAGHFGGGGRVWASAGPWRHGYRHHYHAVPVWGGFPIAAPLFGCQTWGYSAGVSMVGVSATVIDHREWDAAVLAQARAMRAANGVEPLDDPPDHPRRPEPQQPDQRPLDPVARQAHWIRSHLSETPAAASESVDELARRIAAAQQLSRQQQQVAEVRELIAKGDASRLQGRSGVARIFYRTAMRQGSGTWQRVAQERLRELGPSKTPESASQEETAIARLGPFR